MYPATETIMAKAAAIYLPHNFMTAKLKNSIEYVVCQLRLLSNNKLHFGCLQHSANVMSAKRSCIWPSLLLKALYNLVNNIITVKPTINKAYFFKSSVIICTIETIKSTIMKYIKYANIESITIDLNIIYGVNKILIFIYVETNKRY